MVRDLSLVGPLTLTAKPALLGLARTALRSPTALAVERERQATARLAIWWPGPASHRSGARCGAGPGGDETSHAGPGDGR